MTGNFEALLELAKQGDDLAQYKIGKAYLAGDGVPRDAQKAQAWFLKSGYYCAYYSLGVMYEHGDGVPQSHIDATKWFQQAKKQGYRHEGNTYQGYDEAVEWILMATEQGNRFAQCQLARMYRLGQGVEQNDKKAVALERLAVESDEKYDAAVAVVLKHKQASISLVQRQLRIGYNCVARLLERMERNGLVSSMKSDGTRDVIVATSNDSKICPQHDSKGVIDD